MPCQACPVWDLKLDEKHNKFMQFTINLELIEAFALLLPLQALLIQHGQKNPAYPFQFHW
jgi:hypothetical protein